MPLRRTAVALTVTAVLAALTGAALAGPSVSPGATVALRDGGTPSTVPFPNDAFTMPDPQQQTGRRIALPTAGCDAQGRSLCDDLALLNQLDGFDLQPRVTLPFTGQVDLLSVTPATVYLEDPQGVRSGLVQLVEDPSSGVVSGSTDLFLAPRTTYTLVVTNGVKALDGTPVDVCGAGCTARRVPFTTMTSTNTLDRARQQLDDGSAYTRAGIPADARTVDFTKTVPGERAVYSPGSGAMITRGDQTDADPSKPLTTQPAINSAQSASIGFGSILSPQYANGIGVIPQVPTTQAPTPLSAARIGVTMMAGPVRPGSCLQPIVFGPGFTRSKYDLFLSGDALPARGTAVFATDPLGHSYGPASTFTVTTVTGDKHTGTGFGRGKDLDGDGKISSSEGVGPTYTVARQADGTFVPDQPSPQALVGLRDGLIQTVIDNMTLVRALEKGVDVDGDGKVDTCTPTASDPFPVVYYGQSFGGIYGTMLLGTDPHVQVGVPNVPGGPIVDIARLSSFRGNIAAQLQANKPNLLNGGSGRNGFTESLPLRLDPRITAPAPGAIPIQDYFARGNWLERPGSPETYAPRLGTGGTFAAKKVIFETAYTDGTVPNPTAGTLYRAGNLYDKVWVYRNDRTPTYASDPHGFLLDPTKTGRNQGQQQVADWLTSRGAMETDPDGPGPEWEKNPALYRVQLDCLHYPDPQTGQPQTRTPNSPDCTDQSGSLASAQVPSSPSPSGSASASPSASPSASASPSPSAGGTAGPAPTISVSPATTTAGQAARVSGTAAPGSTVRLFAYSRPSTRYRQVRSALAGADGRYTFTVAPSGNTRMYVEAGDRHSGSTVLTVRTSINVRVVRTGTRTYRFSGSTLPKRSGQLVTVYYERDGARTIATRARVAADGTYLVTRTFTGTGVLTFLTMTGSDLNNAAGTSNRARTTVR